MDRAVRKLKLSVAVLAVLAAALVFVAAPAAAGRVTPIDHCIGITHFPAQPIGDSPSKGLLIITVETMYAGGTLGVSLDGASGQVGGEGPIDQLGIGRVEFPLNDFGPHTFTDASIEVDGTSMAVDPTFFGVGGTFTVDANEPVCDPDDLLLAETPPTTSPATTSPATTSPATTSPATTSPPTTIVDDTQVSAAEGGGFSWWILLVIGIVLALGGGVWMAVINGNAFRSGAFTDSSGQSWKYCSGGCKTKMTRDINNKLLIKAIPKAATPCAGCDCVLFSRKPGGKAWVFENSTGAYVMKTAKWSYSARCVEKA